jgi:hypothetical protein
MECHEVGRMNVRKSTYQFKVTLRGISPKIWRRIEVPAAYTSWDLHVAIQDSMGWSDCHLHEFLALNPETGEIDDIGIPDDEGLYDDDMLPGWEVPIAIYFTKRGDRAQYIYDFGDGWQHDVVLEKISERIPKTRYPRCLGGARACPPEDCGGTGGYGRLLNIISDPSHEEHDHIVEWLGGGYDPEAFDPTAVRFDSPRKRWEMAFLDD